MGFDKGNKKKKCIIAGVITALLVIMVVSVAVITNQHARTCNHKKADANIKMTSKAVEAVCAPTDFKETCVNSFMKASPNATEPLDLIKLSFNITIQSIKDGIKKSSVELKAKADDETKGSLELCETVMNDAIDDLTKCFDNFAGFSVDQIEKFVDDLRVWLSGSISYQQTCMDAFEEVKSTLAEDMKNIFKPSKELTSNSLAMITSMSSMFGKSNITGSFIFHFYTSNICLVRTQVILFHFIKFILMRNSLKSSTINANALTFWISRSGRGSWKQLQKAFVG